MVDSGAWRLAGEEAPRKLLVSRLISFIILFVNGFSTRRNVRVVGSALQNMEFLIVASSGFKGGRVVRGGALYWTWIISSSRLFQSVVCICDKCRLG